MKNKTLLKTLSTFLAVAMILCSAPLSGFVEIELPDWFSVKAEAAEYTEGNFKYTVSNGEATLTGCIDATGDIVIHSTLGGHPVTKIDYYAFDNCTSLTSITIPNSVTSIGSGAFSDCTSLARVYYTGDIASWCNISFGSSEANPMYYAKNFYINNVLQKEIVIPDTVTEIKDHAFYSFEEITSVTIPDSVTSIGNYAFRGCTSLTSVTIPDSVVSIGTLAFCNCENLTLVTIPDRVTSIDYGAFRFCFKLEQVYYTGDIESWCNISFDTSDANPTYYAGDVYINGEIVEHVTTSEAATAIKAYVFYNCNSIKSVTIPESVITIHEEAFYYCENIENVYYAGTDEQWDEIAIYDGNDCLKNANKTFLNGGHAHVYSSTVTTEPTCTETGVKIYKCYCSDSYTESIPATGHTWGKWIIAKEPTATTSGLKVRMCTICTEAVESIELPATGESGTTPDIPDEPDFPEEPETKLSVKVNDFTLDYKGTTKINPEIKSSGRCTVEYVSSNESVVTVDKDGNVTAIGEGTAEITIIVTDAKGNLAEDTCKVTVAKAWWQWLIVIFLFGWIWY